VHQQTVLEAINSVTEILKEGGNQNPSFEAKYIVAAILDIKVLDLYLCLEKQLDRQQSLTLYTIVDRRLKNEPLQYIFGKTEFYGLEVKVNPSVLIPRPETELLASRIIDDNRYQLKADYRSNDCFKVLEIGTGSGVIAIALALNFPDWSIDAIDISKEALAVAEINNAAHKANVSFVQSDLFKNVTGKYDIIVSNPPYIRAEDFARLPKEIIQYEPHHALLAAEDGLYFYRQILSQAANYLKQKGSIYFEIGYNQAEAIKEIASYNHFSITNVDKDYNQHNRILTVRSKVQS